ncbi:uncharacterized protein LOC62_04G005975 [Vanrija pseudolonga]|uniref:Uncharacterized protein n=1 Tax=Vanrija pseudolonga TaxID=143232 RepID=A0AAF0YCT9_9TREE|nr:hypothetical protein LOC62_04G005975 [Vanrija pseudolonga]
MFVDFTFIRPPSTTAIFTWYHAQRFLCSQMCELYAWRTTTFGVEGFRPYPQHIFQTTSLCSIISRRSVYEGATTPWIVSSTCLVPPGTSSTLHQTTGRTSTRNKQHSPPDYWTNFDFRMDNIRNLTVHCDAIEQISGCEHLPIEWESFRIFILEARYQVWSQEASLSIFGMYADRLTQPPIPVYLKKEDEAEARLREQWGTLEKHRSLKITFGDNPPPCKVCESTWVEAEEQDRTSAANFPQHCISTGELNFNPFSRA